MWPIHPNERVNQEIGRCEIQETRDATQERGERHLQVKGDSKMTAMYQEGEGNQPCLVQIRESEERLFGHFPVSEDLMCQNILRRFRLLMECFGVVHVRNAWKTAKKKKKRERKK